MDKMLKSEVKTAFVRMKWNKIDKIVTEMMKNSILF